MKHLKHIATVCLLIVTAACSRPNPHRAIYERYAETDNLTVAFVGGYRVNDSLRVDVTFLQATDTAGWSLLKKDFAIPTFPPEIERLMEEGCSVNYRLFPKDHPDMPMDTVERLNNDFAVILRHKLSIYVFHLQDIEQYIQIISRFTHEEVTSNINQKQ